MRPASTRRARRIYFLAGRKFVHNRAVLRRAMRRAFAEATHWHMCDAGQFRCLADVCGHGGAIAQQCGHEGRSP
jgi:hypothetical protein